MANPLKQFIADGFDRVAPPMDQVERVRFWIDRGNSLLLEHGRDDLHWVCVNGHYFIEPR